MQWPAVRFVMNAAHAKLLWVALPVAMVASCGERDQSNFDSAVEKAQSVENQKVAEVIDYGAMLAEFQKELADLDESETLRKAQLEANIGMCFDALGRSDESIVALERAAVRFGELEDGTVGKLDGAGAVADALGLAYHATGRYEDAERYFKDAIEARESAQNGMAATSRAHLGNLYVTMARFSEARRLLKTALEAATDLETQVLRHTYMGRFYHTVGSYQEALDHYAEGEKGARRLWGNDSAQVAAVVGDRGASLFRSGKFDQARDAFLMALSISELVKDFGGVAAALNNLANVAYASGEMEAAAGYLDRCIQVRAESGDTDDPALLTNLNNLGHLAHARGDHDAALLAFDEAKLRTLSLLGHKHPLTVEIFQNLASVHLDSGNRKEAQLLAHQAYESGKALLAEVLTFGTEQQKVDYRRKVDLISLFSALGDADGIARAVLQTKGVVLSSVFEDRSRLGILEPAARREVLEMRRRISLLQQREGMEAEVNELRREIAKLLPAADGAASALHEPPDAIADRIGTGFAVVDYVRYLHYEAPARWTPRYGAVIHSSEEQPVWCPLPDSDEQRLQGLLHSLGQHVRFQQALDSGRKPVKPLRKLEPVLQRLHSSLWKPVRALLPAAVRQVAICPDGVLTSVPFAALLESSGQGRSRFLCESDLKLSFLTSARDVTRRSPEQPNSINTALLFAVTRFGTRELDRSTLSAQLAPDVVDVLAGMNDLPGVARELTEVERLFADRGVRARVVKDELNEAQFFQFVRAPSVLHVASHAFALPPAAIPGDDDDWRSHRRMRLPMYRSGIVVGAFGGANRTARTLEDNIVFAEEAGQLDLRGTWLVTLSACSTAAGEQVAGEGVLGLQRGFFAAGAENVAMSLWPIADAYAPQFMAGFYRKALDSGRPSEALWAAQRAELARIRDTEGLGRAVWLAGPWMVSSRSFPATRRNPSL